MRIFRIKKIIFVTLVIIVVLSGRAYSAALLDRVVAIVNDEVITWSELRNIIELEGKELLKGAEEKEREKKIKELENFFLDNLIDMRLQLQEAQRKGLDVSASEIDDAVNEIRKKYNLTEEALINSLGAEGLTLKEYRTRLEEQILLSKVVNLEVRANILISDKKIEEYYEADKDKYKKEEKVRIRQIFFRKPGDDLQKAAVEARSREVIQRINKGDDFAQLAGEFSEDPSREFGGDLGYVKRGSVLKEIEAVAFSLQKGEVSRPFWSSAGLHIIKLEDRVEGGGIEKVREEIKDILFEKAFRLKYDEWVKKLREKAYIEIKL